MVGVEIFTPLNDREIKPVLLSAACGALNLLLFYTPGKDHTKRRRILINLQKDLWFTTRRNIPGVKKGNQQLFSDYMQATDKILKKYAEDGATRAHMLLNFTSFCLTDLPVKSGVRSKLSDMFDLLDGVWDTEKKKDLGKKVFTEIENEITSIIVERKGVVL